MDNIQAEIMNPDMQVVKQVLAGDTEAYRQLVDRHRNKLFGVLMRILADPQLAEEVAQDTFVKAYTRLEGFRGEAAFSTWLIQIGVHLARDTHRRRRREESAGIISLEELQQKNASGWEPTDERQAADPLASLASREKWEYFEAALAEIPAGFREVFTLRHLENLDYREISRITGDTPGTLKVRAHRARALLRERMAAKGVELGLRSTAPLVPIARKQEGS